MVDTNLSDLPVLIGVCCSALAFNSWVGWLLTLRRPGTWRTVFAARIIGATSLFLPLIIFGTDVFPAGWMTWPAQLVTLLLVIVAVLFQKFRRRNETDRFVYGYLYSAPSTINFLLAEVFGWAIYLYPYEALFRGLLLNALLQSFHWLPAIFIVNVIYAAAHIQQGRRELVASFFAGWLFAALAIWTGNFLAPFIIHLALGLGNSYFMSKTGLTEEDRSKSNSLGHVG